jgi:predicted glycosyltransferase
MYSQDGMGLGHLRRTHNIAREILSQEPGCRILVVADSPVAPFFTPLAGMQFHKLETIVKVGTSDWRSRSPSVGIDGAVRLRAESIRQAFRDFDPDVMLVDHMPLGALGELKPVLDDASEGGKRAKLVLGLRDVLDRPETIRDVWTQLGAYDYLARYDHILIHGCRDVFDAEAAYGLSPHARQVTYCNYVAPRPNDGAQPVATATPFILVMGGGGADAFPMAKAFLDGLPLLLEHTKLEGLILAGPNMPAEQREQLFAQAKGYPIQVRTSVSDATEWLKKASAVVTMGGYNSLAEVLQWRKKALVVPRRAPSAEQWMRAQLFAERQLVRVLDPETLTPQLLAEELLGLLAEDTVPDEANIPPLDGAQRAAALLLAALEEAPAAGPARG